MTTDTNTTPANPRQFWRTMLTFSFFIIIPVITVLFSKYGLDKYREMRSEMKLFKDSISIGQFNLYDSKGDTFNAQTTANKAIVLHFVDAQTSPEVWTALQKIQKAFAIPEDKPKIIFLSCFTSIPSDTTFTPPTPSANLDGTNWHLVQNGTPELAQRLKISPEKMATTLVLIDPKGYVRDHYDVSQPDEASRLVHHLPIVMPRNARKKIQYRPDSTLYK